MKYTRRPCIPLIRFTPLGVAYVLYAAVASLSFADCLRVLISDFGVEAVVTVGARCVFEP
jgi:hypothetical protein